ncbi:MAG TPA: hypothetical protein VFF20_06345 [Pseudogracilibacillus sp.]|nr:hypothetical protein [Pseudogracilibacillus sp.]
MTSILLLLSFLIHLLVLITIYHLYEKSKRNKDEQAEQLEKMLTDFMHDIRVENNKLEEKINENELHQQISYNHDSSSQSTISKSQNQSKAYISKDDDGELESLDINYTRPKNKFASHLAKASQTQENEDIIEKSLASQIMRLAQAGKSIDDIAKQLNRGKTEVELMLKMNQDELQ